jgi:uncharacterized protein (DUF2342 family)
VVRVPLEYRVEWNGTAITGPGISVFHGRTDGVATTGAAAQSLANRVRTFWDAVKGLVPGGVTWTFPNEVTELDTSSGVLLGVHAVTSPADVVSGGASSSHSRPSGGRVDWNTSAVVAGRRLRGRTYIVPLTGAQYDSAGSLSTTCIATLESAATTYRSTGVFTEATPVVWSRTHGILADVIGSSVTDRASILRSRRD